MAFRFRMQSVLRLREREKSQRQGELAQAIQADQTLIQQSQSIEQQLQEIDEQMRAAQASHLDIDFMLSLRRHQSNTRQMLRQVEAQRDQLAQEIERRQIKLAEANQQVQVMEKLELQQRQEFDGKIGKQEQEALDEFKVRQLPG